MYYKHLTSKYTHTAMYYPFTTTHLKCTIPNLSTTSGQDCTWLYTFTA